MVPYLGANPKLKNGEKRRGTCINIWYSRNLLSLADGIEFHMGQPQESVAEELINRKLKKSSMVDSFKLQSDKSGKVVPIPIFQESDDPGFQLRGQVTTSVIGKKKDGGAGAADAATDPGLIRKTIFFCWLCLSGRS